MLFHMVSSVLFSMAALSTAIAKILNGCWRILTNQRMVEKATMESKTEATMWKSIKNWIRKWCHKWVYILFGVTYPKKKQWGGRSTNFCILFVWSGIYCMAGPGQETAKLNAIEEGCKQRTSNLLYPIQRTGMTVTRSLYLGIFFYIT